LAGIDFSSTGFQARSVKDQFSTSQISTLFAPDPSGFQVGDIIGFPGHAGIVTAVDSNGNVISFVGSQSSTGPATVNVATSKYWANRLKTAKAYIPCVPTDSQQASVSVSDGGYQPGTDAFLAWVESIPLGGGIVDSDFHAEMVEETIEYE
jgi:hypothetical protein